MKGLQYEMQTILMRTGMFRLYADIQPTYNRLRSSMSDTCLSVVTTSSFLVTFQWAFSAELSSRHAVTTSTYYVRDKYTTVLLKQPHCFGFLYSRRI